MVLLATFVIYSAINGIFCASSGDPDWWKHGMFYQIYPRSFKDGNNDGIGDLKGIISKLDHVKDAGVTAAWLSPIYKSPQVDQGYDISDYREIDPDYGTLNDLRDLLAKAAELGVKIIMDLVPNHTSDQHEWFKASVNGTEKYKDYYVWHDGKYNDTTKRMDPPNNWVSVFSNSAWTWNEERKQYYLHQFTEAQPDLNFRNPAVVEEICDVMRFWLDFGVDGFRIDAAPFLIEDDQFRDEPRSDRTDFPPTEYGYLEHIHTFDQDGTFDLIYTWREVVDNYTRDCAMEDGGDARIIMTEAYSDINHTMLYYGKRDGSRLGAHFTFNFNMITDLNINSTAADYVKAARRWLDNIPDIYISNWVFGNHDQHRVATRLGKENVDGCNMLMALLPGIGVTYNGEEIGQENGEVKYEEGKDPAARDPKEFVFKTRDFERTPFQWDNTTNAGFNEGYKTWLPVSKKYLDTNLAAQNVPGIKSHYNIYKALMEFRKNIVVSEGVTVITSVANVVVLKRELEDKVVLLVFNIGDVKEMIGIDQFIKGDVRVVLSDIKSQRTQGNKLDDVILLEPHEALVMKNY